jgi:hypothetical protein
MTAIVMMRVLFIAFIFWIVPPSDAEAQVVERPPRVYRGLFGAGVPDANRWRHSVTLTGNAFGGFDDNLSPTAGEGTSVTANTPGTRGYTGFGGLQIQYASVKSTRTIQVDTRGFSNGFSGLGLRPVFGGEVSGRIATPIGRRFSLSGYQRYSDSPMFAPGTATPRSSLAGSFEPASVPLAETTSYLVRRSTSWDGNMTLERRMSVRTTVVVGGTHGRSRFDQGIGDSEMWGGTLNYQRSIGRGSAVAGGYNFSSTLTHAAAGSARPFENHALMLSASTSRRVGPRRQLAMSVSAGVNQVNTLSSLTDAPLTYLTPAQRANVRFDFTQTWNVAADYARVVSVIEGVSLDSFVADTVSLRAGGHMWKADVALSGDWASGHAGPTGSGTYESYTGIVQIQFAVNRWIDAHISQTFYAYRLEGVTMIVDGLTTRLDRQASRVGLVFRLPLYGQYAGTRSRAGR